VFGRTGAVVATEGDYTLTQLGDVTLTSPSNGQVLKYNGTAWVNGLDAGGITTLNTLTALSQTFATGTSGTDFNIASATATHTFNIPTASATNRGALSSADWTTFNNKQNALTNPITGTGTSGQVAYFNGTSSITSESNLFWDATNDRLGIGTATPLAKLVTVGANVINPANGFGGNHTVQIIDTTAMALGVGGGIGLGGVFDTGGIQTIFAQINGIKENNTNTNFASALTFSTRINGGNITERARIASTGNFLLNTTTDAGFRLDVNGTARVQGRLTVGTASTNAEIYANPSTAMILSGGQADDVFQFSQMNTGRFATQGATELSFFRLTIGQSTSSGGNSIGSVIRMLGNVTNSALSSVYNNIQTNTTINTTGGTTTYRGFFHNPTLTSTTGLTHRAIETVTGDVLLGTTSGNVAIGTSTLATATELTLGGSQTASSAIARGGLINTTLVAAANNDVLVGLDVDPIFSSGAFSGLSRYSARFNNSLSNTSLGLLSYSLPRTNNGGLTLINASAGTETPHVSLTAGTVNGSIWANTARLNFSVTSPSGVGDAGGVFLFRIDNRASKFAVVPTSTSATADASFYGQAIWDGGAAAIFRANSSTQSVPIFRVQNQDGTANHLVVSNVGNTLLNTATDAGFRLDVNGTARVVNTLRVGADGVAAGRIELSRAAASATGFMFMSGNSFVIENLSTIIEFRTNGSSAGAITSTGALVLGSSAANASSVLDLQSTTRGFLPPRMTTTQKNAISSPATGLQVYDTTLNQMSYYNGTTWTNI
jgi:hypothetical protein